LRSRQLCRYSIAPHSYTEPEDSLPCSQEPSLSLARSVQAIEPHSNTLRSILVLPPTYVLVFLFVCFLLTFLPISYMHYSSPLCVLDSLPTSYFCFDHCIYTWRRGTVPQIKPRQLLQYSCNSLFTNHSRLH
jgi:hypothetical protein